MGSVLYPVDVPPPASREAPECFHDLNVDWIVEGITAPFTEYDLCPYLFAGPVDLDTVAYRQEIMRDVEQAPVARAIEAFASGMRRMRLHLDRAGKAEYRYEGERWFLASVQEYAHAVGTLHADMRTIAIRSRGLLAFRAYLAAYAEGPRFQDLVGAATALAAGLSAIRYNLLIKDTSITVRQYAGEPDYTAVVERVFEKFRRGAVKDHHSTFQDTGRLNHIEAAVLQRVALLHPSVFASLDAFCAANAQYLDATIARFDREIHFYVAYLAYIAPCRRAGLPFCYPRLSPTSKEIACRDTFDLALASKLVSEGSIVVVNDLTLSDPERILVVTGPNQGGKTTFARTFGQLHYLANLGCPVPGATAQLFHFDHVFVHFERQERLENMRGKLQDDLVRIRRILEAATPRSIVVMNEIFSSTTLEDALYLSRQVLARLSGMDLLAVCVTFLDELAAFDEKTVSMVSTLDPREPAVRTFRIERRPADGLAYALAIAEKHRVTYDWLLRRVGG